MLLNEPAVDAAHVSKLLRDACERARKIPRGVRVLEESAAVKVQPVRAIAEYDFRKARQPLLRARDKSSIRMVKPLRRLATNQEAVNEGLVDAVAALIAINKSMAAEIDALTAQVNELAEQASRTAKG